MTAYCMCLMSSADEAAHNAVRALHHPMNKAAKICDDEGALPEGGRWANISYSVQVRGAPPSYSQACADVKERIAGVCLSCMSCLLEMLPRTSFLAA